MVKTMNREEYFKIKMIHKLKNEPIYLRHKKAKKVSVVLKESGHHGLVVGLVLLKAVRPYPETKALSWNTIMHRYKICDRPSVVTDDMLKHIHKNADYLSEIVDIDK